MVWANFLISPEARLQEPSRSLGDLPAVIVEHLDPNWQTKFKALPRGVATLSDEELQFLTRSRNRI